MLRPYHWQRRRPVRSLPGHSSPPSASRSSIPQAYFDGERPAHVALSAEPIIFHSTPFLGHSLCPGHRLAALKAGGANATC